nr:Uncharacterised protein [Klebsiella pneumoniae]
MGFKAAGQTKPGGQLVRLAEKIDLLRQRPAIVARQQIDKARVEAAGLGEAGLQARQMLLGRFMLGGEHPPPLKRMAIYSSPDACRRSASCRRSATVNGTRASIPQQPTRCSSSSVCGRGRHSPEGAKAFQLHGGYLRRTSRRAGRRASRTAGWPPAGRYYRSRRRGETSTRSAPIRFRPRQPRTISSA